MTEYEIELKELSKFVPRFANSEKYLCSKFEEDFSLEIKEKMYITKIQNYKKVVQLTLRAEKLTSEKMTHNIFQKRKRV